MTASPALMKESLNSSLVGVLLKVVKTYFHAERLSAEMVYLVPYEMIYSAFL